MTPIVPPGPARGLAQGALPRDSTARVDIVRTAIERAWRGVRGQGERSSIAA